MVNPRVEGTVAAGFESVKSLYEHNMQTLAERSTQLCVYVGTERVVDLWCSVASEPGFSADSLINVFSSGKSLESIAMASLVDRGLLRYDAKVVDYWPAFGANGKDVLTVADVMRHEGGLASFDTPLPLDDLRSANIKKNAVGRVIEQQRLRYPAPPRRREYHALTRGWIVNEIFRRVDPTGRTIGEFLREEICQVLDVDALIGVNEDERRRIVPVTPLGVGFQLRHAFLPKFLGRKMERNIFGMASRVLGAARMVRGGSSGGAKVPIEGMQGVGVFNDPAMVQGESPSANAHSNARSLAAIAAMLAARGNWAGKQMLSDDAWEALHSAPLEADMGFTTTFTQGGVALYGKPTGTVLDRAANVGREGFFGWMGLGGSIFQWHPERQIGFGYVPTSLNVLDLVNERGKAYQAEVLRCVERLE